MKKVVIIVSIVLVSLVNQAKAQFVTIDPANLAQGIVNTAKQIIETSTTATNTINTFKETQKLYNQGKQFYDGAPV
jgi:conjugal transfer/entry exclusion protein